MQDVRIDLPVPIGPKVVTRKRSEREQKLDDLCTLVEEIDGVGGELSALRKKEKELREDVQSLSVEIRDQERLEPVTCEQVPIHDRQQVVVIRRDTDEIVNVREMNEVEATQVEIGDDDTERVDEVVKRLDAGEYKP